MRELARREFRCESHLVDVSIAEEDGDAVGVSTLEPEQREHHSHGAADRTALVNRVAAVDELPARPEGQVGTSVVQSLTPQLEGV